MNLTQDVRFAFRTLAKSKMLTAVAIGSLALVVTGNTTVFSILNAFMIRPLPYKDAERLMLIGQSALERPDDFTPFSPANFNDLRRRTQVFEVMAAYTEDVVNLTGEGEPEQLSVARASPSLLPMLGIDAAWGRVFSEAEERPGVEPVVLLTHEFWKRRFGGEPNVVGGTIRLGREAHVVIGILPEHFEFVNSSVDVWLPYTLDPASLERAERSINVGVAKLRHGITPEQARSELSLIAADLERKYPEANRGYGIVANTIREIFPGDTDRRLFALLQGGAIFVLLIACANIANLLLARAQARRREIVLRLALGAGRARILRQLLTESVLLAVIGGVVGTAASLAAVRAIRQAIAGEVPYNFLPVVDARVLVFSLVIAVAAGLFFGLMPALHSARLNLASALKEGGDRTASTGRGWSRRLLVIGQMAMALTLLCGAGLLLRSFLALQYAPPGFESERMLTFRLSLPEKEYSEAQLILFYQRLREELRAVPGAVTATAASTLPKSRATEGAEVEIPGRDDGDDPAPLVTWLSIPPGYFDAMKIPLLRGRDFLTRDRAESLAVVVVDQRFADRFWPGDDAVGKQLRVLDETREVVGVAADVVQRRLGDLEGVSPMVYLPWTQHPMRAMNFMLRSRSQDPTTLAESARQTVWRLDPDLPIANVMSLETFMANQYVGMRVFGAMIAGFGVVALLLASVGVYGVLAYSVAQRTQEIGVRVALGASRNDVLTMVLRDGLKLAFFGLVIGLPGVFVVRRLIEGALEGLAGGALVLAPLITLGLMLVTLLASLLPARRASNLSPVEALRMG